MLLLGLLPFCILRTTGLMVALRAVLVEGSCMRVRPLLMTLFTTLLGLLPLMFATGTGAQIMKRLATPTGRPL